MNTATAPIWQTETSPPHLRGKLVMFEMLMNIVGFSLCNWINYGLSFAGGAVAWRFPLAFQFVFIIALFATVPFLPESPLGSCITSARRKQMRFWLVLKAWKQTTLSSLLNRKIFSTVFHTKKSIKSAGEICSSQIQMELNPFDDSFSVPVLNLSSSSRVSFHELYLIMIQSNIYIQVSTSCLTTCLPS